MSIRRCNEYKMEIADLNMIIASRNKEAREQEGRAAKRQEIIRGLEGIVSQRHVEYIKLLESLDSPAQMSYKGGFVPINSTGMRQLIDENTLLRKQNEEAARWVCSITDNQRLLKDENVALKKKLQSYEQGGFKP